jgi:hypothetical protein
MKLFCLIIGLLLSNLAQSQWDQYLAQWDDKPGSMLVDLSYQEMIDSIQLPYLLGVGHQFSPCSIDGFPDTTVYEQLYKLSDKLFNYMDIQSTCKLVGTFTHDCTQVDYYYLKDSVGMRSFLKNYFTNEGSGFPPIVYLSYDPENEFYQNRIYPDIYITEYRQNTATVQTLIDAGDQIREPRKIDHWAYFGTDIERDRYSTFVLESGFQEEEKGFHRGERQPYFYHFSRVDNPTRDDITDITVILQTEAKALNGIYGGWECPIVNKEP